MSKSHRFTANNVLVKKSPLFLVLGDVDAGDVVRQSFSIMREDEGSHWLVLWLIDQGYTCDEKGMEHVELGDSELRVALKAKVLRSADRDEPPDDPVSELIIGFSLSDSALKELRDGCEATFREACAFRYVGRRLT